MSNKIGFGGGCHWCTEAVFLSLKGVQTVAQGWVASLPPNEAYSEAVVVTFLPETISLRDLIEVHLHTHASTANHQMRHKYRSAIYCFREEELAEVRKLVAGLQDGFDAPLVTQVLLFAGFKPSLPEHQNYYYAKPGKPFCTMYIQPKLQLLKNRFSQLAIEQKQE